MFLDETAQAISFSAGDDARRIFRMVSIQVMYYFKKLCSSSPKKAISTRTLPNSGKPAYLRVLWIHISVLHILLYVSVQRSMSDNGLGLQNIVSLFIWGRITVWICNKSKSCDPLVPVLRFRESLGYWDRSQAYYHIFQPVMRVECYIWVDMVRLSCGH